MKNVLLALFFLTNIAFAQELTGHWYCEAGANHGSSWAELGVEGHWMSFMYPNYAGTSRFIDNYSILTVSEGIYFKYILNGVFEDYLVDRPNGYDCNNYSRVRIIGDRMRIDNSGRVSTWVRTSGTQRNGAYSGIWTSEDKAYPLVVDDNGFAYNDQGENYSLGVYWDDYYHAYRPQTMFYFLPKTAEDFILIELPPYTGDPKIENSTVVGNTLYIGDVYTRVSGDPSSVSGDWTEEHYEFMDGQNPNRILRIDEQAGVFIYRSLSNGEYIQSTPTEIEVVNNRIQEIWTERYNEFILFDEGQKMIFVKQIYTAQ